MDLGLKGKVALVAGSSRGLGQAVAAELASEGASLILCARGQDDLSRTREAISEKAATEVLAVPGDVSLPEDVERVIAAGLERFKRIDILVTNAGGPPAGVFEDISAEMWRNAYHLTLESALNLTRGVLPGMKQRRWGRVVNITSIAVKQPVENLILSNSLRAAVTGFARTLANEVASCGITVNNVLPGYTRTRRLELLANSIAARQNLAPEKIYGGWESEIPMRRLGEPRELAALVAFLASERASYITGTSITVDGGWVRSLL